MMNQVPDILSDDNHECFAAMTCIEHDTLDDEYDLKAIAVLVARSTQIELVDTQ